MDIQMYMQVHQIWGYIYTGAAKHVNIQGLVIELGFADCRSRRSTILCPNYLATEVVVGGGRGSPPLHDIIYEVSAMGDNIASSTK